MIKWLKKIFTTRKEEKVTTRSQLLTSIGAEHRKNNSEPIRKIPSYDHIVDFMEKNPVPNSFLEAMEVAKKNKEMKRQKYPKEGDLFKAAMLRSDNYIPPIIPSRKRKKRKSNHYGSSRSSCDFVDQMIVYSASDSMF